MSDIPLHAVVVEAEGHLIDSQLLNAVFDTVVTSEADVRRPAVRHRPQQRRPSCFDAQSRRRPSRSSDRCSRSWSRSAAAGRAARRAAPSGGSRRLRAGRLLLDDEPPHARAARRTVDRGRAPAHGRGHRRRSEAAAICRKLRDVARRRRRRLRRRGIRVTPEFRDRDRLGFAFMTNDISSERRVEVSVSRIAAHDARGQGATGGRIAFVAGPVVVHTGGVGLLLRAHSRAATSTCCSPATRWRCTTSSTRCSAPRSASTSRPAAPVEEGHRNHMRAINTINRAGGSAAAVEQGVLTSGVMYECVRARRRRTCSPAASATTARCPTR